MAHEKRKHNITARETIVAGKLLDEHFDLASRRYHDGWSDEKIALQVDPSGNLSDRSIAGLRRSLGMAMPEPGKYKADIDQLQKTIIELQQAVMALQLKAAKAEWLLHQVGNLSALRGTQMPRLIAEAEQKFKVPS